MTAMNDPIFHDDTAARAHLEAIRWPDGPICPHCGNVDRDQIAKVEGRKKSHRPGLYYCNACKGQFTVTVGTVMERSKVPLHKWIFAFHMYAASKKGMSAHQLHRMIGVTYKTAWFMAHRIREAMTDKSPFDAGSGGGIVEVDETFIGLDPARKKSAKARGAHHKMKVLSLVDRSTGRARSIVVDDLKAKTLVPILRENIAKKATVYTDEASQYSKLADDFATHDFVRHSAEEYARGNIHTNTIEGFFSIFKRGMKGVYQHCAKRHLHRYTSEFDFRYSNRTITDWERTTVALKGIEGKRLTYRRTDAWASA